MDTSRIDAVARALIRLSSRRAALPLLGSLLAARLPGALPAFAREKKNKRKKKKATLCLDGQTITASRKKRKKLLRQGATPGACLAPVPPPPPPPASCAPQCEGASCGCGSNALCHQGACHACTVTCTGNDAVCGAALSQALAGGGTIFACPGRYVGSFLLDHDVSLIGAGDADGPATNTILDAIQQGRVMHLRPGVRAELRGLRITGGKKTADSGGGILAEGTLAMTACTVSENRASLAGGIFHSNLATGPLTLTACHVADNAATVAGGGGITQSSQNHAVTLIASVVSANGAVTEGAGLAVTQGLAELRGSVIDGNLAGSHGGGLAVYLAGGVTFDGASRITGNIAGDPGGGIYSNGSDAIFLNSATISGNEPDECFPADIC